MRRWRHRILWNTRPARSGRDDECIDEVVITEPRMVHIEQVHDRCWWIGIYLDDDKCWMGNFMADSRGGLRFVEQENTGVEWDRDEAHRWPTCS